VSAYLGGEQGSGCVHRGPEAGCRASGNPLWQKAQRKQKVLGSSGYTEKATVFNQPPGTGS
jgi:hypothetical protein